MHNPKQNSVSIAWPSPGCCFVHNETYGILIGCVSEVIKFLTNEGIGHIPIRAIVLSDTAQAHGISNWALEFPVCRHLFIDEPTNPNQKLIVLGTKSQLRRAKAMLEIALTGPTPGQYKQWAKRYDIRGARFRMLQKSAHAFALKNDQGVPLKIDEILEFRCYNHAREAVIDNFYIRHRGDDWFHVATTDLSWTKDIQLQFDKRAKSPFKIKGNETVYKPYRFAFRSLMNSNGFDHQNGCTSFIIWVNGVPILWDAAPFVFEAIHAYGLNVDDLGGVILSHLHEDHSSLLELLASGDSIRLFTTPEIYESLLIKIAALTNRDLADHNQRRSIERLLTYEPITCGKSIDLFGAEFIPHYCIHSIPTFGGRFRLRDNDRDYELLISGDTVGPAKLDELEKTKAVSQNWIEACRNWVTGNEDLIIYDGGADPSGLHADPADPALRLLALNLGDKLRFGHRSASALPDGSKIKIAYPGYEKIFIEGQLTSDDFGALQDAFKPFDFHDQFQLKAFLAQGTFYNFQANKQIIKAGDLPDYVYILTEGKIAIEVDGELIATLSRGAIFGEMAVISGESRCADVHSISSSRLFKIPKAVFAALIERNMLIESFQTMWQRREYLNNAQVFRDLPYKQIQSLTRELNTEQFVDAATTIIEQGTPGSEAYLIVSGSARVIRDNKIVATLGPGDIFGEIAALSDSPSLRTATVVSKSSCRLVKINSDILRKLNDRYFSVNCVIHDLLKKRNALHTIAS